MRLTRVRKPFDGPDWIFEVKHDGFRALAYLEHGACRLFSRNGHEFKGFRPLCEEIARNLKVRNAILDGEICCLGSDGRSLFNELLFRRGVPHFYAFDLLWLNGRDLRQWSKAAQHHAVPRRHDLVVVLADGLHPDLQDVLLVGRSPREFRPIG